MRLFGLIGFPLSHSFSAKYFEEKFTAENITETDYRLFPLESITDLRDLIDGHPELQGFNITIPHKVAILPYLNDITPEAAAVGAVNCVKIHRNPSGFSLSGFNTDIYGFEKALLPALKPFHTKALVLGTGGAAKAVCYALREMGISFLLVSRSHQEEGYMNYSQLTRAILTEYQLIINTTPVGMYPEVANCPDIPYHFLNSSHLLYDLVYNPAETRFLKLGREAGASTMNGLQMLELQAEKSWEIWNL